MTSNDKTNKTTGIETEKTEVVKNTVVDDVKRSQNSHVENVKDNAGARSEKVEGAEQVGKNEKNAPHMDKTEDNIGIGKGIAKAEAKNANVEIKTACEDESANKDIHSNRK